MNARKLKKADAVVRWALGILMCALLFEHRPLKFTEPLHSYKATESTCSEEHPVLIFPKDLNITSDCKDLITCLLQYAASDRLTAKKALKHPWLFDGKKEEIDLEFSKYDWVVSHAFGNVVAKNDNEWLQFKRAVCRDYAKDDRFSKIYQFIDLHTTNTSIEKTMRWRKFLAFEGAIRTFFGVV